MQSDQNRLLKNVDYFIIDLLCLEFAFGIACFMRYHNFEIVMQDNYVLINILIVLSHIALIFITEPYTTIKLRGYLKEFKTVLIHNLLLLAMVLVLLFIVKLTTGYSRLIIGSFIVCNLVLEYIAHILYRRLARSKQVLNRELNHMVVFTTYQDAKELLNGLKQVNYQNFLIDGVILLEISDEDRLPDYIDGIPVVATEKNMYDYIKSHVIDEVFLRCSSEKMEQLTDVFLTMGIMVHLSIDSIFREMPNPVVESINKYAVVTSSINVSTTRQKVLKRIMDICGALVGLLITVVLFLIFAPIIYIQSPGPVFFKQTRVGKNGRTFQIIKFRSMYMDAEERKKELMEQNKMQGHMFKMDNDPRIIPIGHFIRKTSIDEFPQFWNVLKGDMSLVGTRPPTVDEYEKYELHHRSRLAIKPGITGMWQISGRSNITDFEEVVRLDNEYIRNFSLGLDIKILWKTIFIVLTQKGSE